MAAIVVRATLDHGGDDARRIAPDAHLARIHQCAHDAHRGNGRREHPASTACAQPGESGAGHERRADARRIECPSGERPFREDEVRCGSDRRREQAGAQRQCTRSPNVSYDERHHREQERGTEAQQRHGRMRSGGERRYLFDGGIETMNLVYEKHVAFLQVGEQSGEVASLFDDRPGGRAQLRAHLVGNDVGERGLAKSGRACQENVIERLASLQSGFDEDAQVVRHAALADVLGKARRTQRQLELLLVIHHGRIARICWFEFFGHNEK